MATRIHATAKAIEILLGASAKEWRGGKWLDATINRYACNRRQKIRRGADPANFTRKDALKLVSGKADNSVELPKCPKCLLLAVSALSKYTPFPPPPPSEISPTPTEVANHEQPSREEAEPEPAIELPKCREGLGVAETVQ